MKKYNEKIIKTEEEEKKRQELEAKREKIVKELNVHNKSNVEKNIMVYYAPKEFITKFKIDESLKVYSDNLLNILGNVKGTQYPHVENDDNGKNVIDDEFIKLSIGNEIIQKIIIINIVNELKDKGFDLKGSIEEVYSVLRYLSYYGFNEGIKVFVDKSKHEEIDRYFQEIKSTSGGGRIRRTYRKTNKRTNRKNNKRTKRCIKTKMYYYMKDLT